MAVIEYEVKDHVAVITINRPDRYNALNYDAFLGLAESFQKYEKDDDAWVAILTGTGKHFSVGLDLKEALAKDPTNVKLPEIPIRDLYFEEEYQKPVIAAVNGYAIGGGFFLALHADLRVAAETAAFQIVEVQRGITSGLWPGKHMVLQANLPYAITAEILSGAKFDGKRAYEIGFVNKVVPEEKLMDAALEMAGQFVKVPPLAPYFNLKHHRTLKRARCILPADLDRECADDMQRCYDSEDMKESTKAFTEKRQPVYKRK